MRVSTYRRINKDEIIELLLQLLAEERNKNKGRTPRIPRPVVVKPIIAKHIGQKLR